MNQERFWQDMTTLPPDAQQQVLDLIAFLKNQFAERNGEIQVQSKLRDEPFVGIWRDNEAVADSSA